MIARVWVRCAICGDQFAYHAGIGRGVRCCGKECWDEYQKRDASAICGQERDPLDWIRERREAQ